jgi:hypothetical protein
MIVLFAVFWWHRVRRKLEVGRNRSLWERVSFFYLIFTYTSTVCPGSHSLYTTTLTTKPKCTIPINVNFSLDVYSYLLFNFNDYPSGMVTLFNLLVMGNWQVWMEVRISHAPLCYNMLSFLTHVF